MNFTSEILYHFYFNGTNFSKWNNRKKLLYILYPRIFPVQCSFLLSVVSIEYFFHSIWRTSCNIMHYFLDRDKSYQVYLCVCVLFCSQFGGLVLMDKEFVDSFIFSFTIGKMLFHFHQNIFAGIHLYTSLISVYLT